MRLWLDGQCLQTGSRFRGIGRYITEFIAGVAVARPDVELVVSLNAAMAEEAIAARAMLAAHVSPRNIHVWQGLAEGGEGHVGYSDRRRLDEIALAHHVALLAPDIALSASPFEGAFDVATPYFPMPKAPVKAAAIFYDAIPHRYPDRYFLTASAREYFDRRLKRLGAFGHVLAISDFSLSELAALVPSARGTNIAAAVSPAFAAMADAHRDEMDRWPRPASVLYVGGLDWRKNVNGAARAFEYLPHELKARVQFIIAGLGPPALEAEVREAWADAGMPAENLALLGHVEDAALVRLYRAAGVVIQPSLMEGFGLTALEAMYCGAPVIASRGGALAEVVSNPDAIFNPLDPRDIARKITHALMDEAFARELVDQGRAQSVRFSWTKTAETAIAALEHALMVGRPARPRPGLADLRTLAAEALTSLSLDPELKAHAMAAAEPGDRVGRLLVDTTATCDADHGTGIQRVVKKIAERLVAENPTTTRLIYGKTDDGFVEARLAPDGRVLQPDHDAVRPVSLMTGDTVLMLDSSWEHHLVHGRVLPRALLRGCDVITTLYDLVPVRTPAFCDPGMPGIFAAWLQSALAYSTGFACISKAVAEELLALLESIRFPRPMKIGHWTLGANFSDAAQAVPSARTFGRDPAFLMVGTIEPRKGYPVALRAFEKLWRSGFNGQLTIVGRRGWGVDSFMEQLHAHPEIGRRLIWLERIDDAALAAAYAQTDALISTSYAEGFGLPIVEAGHFHKPVIASELPVFREVARFAPAARFFAAGDADALAQAVRAFVADRVDVTSAPVDGFSWAESAAQLRGLIEDDGWQIRYTPRQTRFDKARGDMGMTRVPAPLGRDVGRLELVEGPTRSVGASHFEFVVRATNLTEEAWSSIGPHGDDHFGVVLDCQVVAPDGRPLDPETARTRLPWVMPPQAPHYLRIRAPSDYANSAALARIVLRQIGGGELCAPVFAPLDTAPVSTLARAES